jgi:hypothetical protein
MSHVELSKCDIDPGDGIKFDLPAAVARLYPGAVLEKASTYKWFGRHVGDYPMPEGLTKDDLGKCEYKIRFPAAATNRGYEVGIIKHPLKPGVYTFIYDFWDAKLKQTVGGDNAQRLTQLYAIERAKRLAKKNGEVFKEVQEADGTLKLYCAKKREVQMKQSIWKRTLSKITGTVLTSWALLVAVMPDGLCVRFHDETQLQTGDLGHVFDAPRVTEIILNTATQQWEVVQLSTNQPIHSAPSYQACRDWESVNRERFVNEHLS